MKARAWAIIVILMAALLPQLAQGAQQDDSISLPLGAAVVREVKGEATIKRADGSPLNAVRGETLEPGTTIHTFAKSSILLELSDGSQVLVKANTQIVLQDPRESPMQYLQMLIGKLVVKIKKRLENAPSFRMGTPTAVITVRGTQFMVEVSKKQRTFVEVYEGVVEVIGIPLRVGQSGPVRLQRGYATEVSERGPRPPWRWDGGDLMGSDGRYALWGGRLDGDSRMGQSGQGSQDRERSSDDSRHSSGENERESEHHDP
ncbi:MAG: FecR domain-containing protein [Terriglobales bacterium]